MSTHPHGARYFVAFWSTWQLMMPNLTASAKLPGLFLSSPVATQFRNFGINRGWALGMLLVVIISSLFPCSFFFFFLGVGSEFPSSINLSFQLYKVFKTLGKGMPIIGFNCDLSVCSSCFLGEGRLWALQDNHPCHSSSCVCLQC